MTPYYKIRYKRYSTLGEYTICTPKTIEEVIDYVKTLLSNSNVYDVTLESSIAIKLNYDNANIEETIKTFDSKIIKD